MLQQLAYRNDLHRPYILLQLKFEVISDINLSGSEFHDAVSFITRTVAKSNILNSNILTFSRGN